MPKRLDLKTVRYIKLGSNGAWATDAFDAGVVYFGAHGVDHDLCVSDDWNAVTTQLEKINTTQQGITNGLRQLKAFYSREQTVWITMAHGHLWWCLSKGDTSGLKSMSDDEPSRSMDTIDGWHKSSLDGQPLLLRNISSSLTKTAGYRRTICDVEAADYLLRLINDERDPLQKEAEKLLEQQLEITQKLIQRLHWSEFETLIDLIFSRNGWRRTSVLGRSIPDVDLIAEQVITGDTAWVQIKTSTNQSELDDYIKRFEKDGSCTDFFFVCHSASNILNIPKGASLHLWMGRNLSEQAISAGLFNWLVEQG